MSTNSESESESETEKKPNSPPNLSDNIIALQLGDVIQIRNPVNEQLNEQTFLIEYIDKTKIFILNTETFDKLRITISADGTLGDGNITRIAILSRSDTPSYAIQNGLLPDNWINIHFGGDFPNVITGKITNLEQDMIEVTTVDGDIIYINFDYKGIPEDLPIENIEIREKPSEPLSGHNDYAQEEDIPQDVPEDIQPDIEDLKPEIKYVDPETFKVNVPIKNIKDQLREFIIRADQVQFGNEELGPIVQYVDVSLKSQRYSIETQVSDLLDELLSTIPNIQRTPRVLNNIHTMIERFKQLRENFSFVDKYGNVEGFLVKEANYKPLVDNYFKSFKTNLYWILPIVKNIKKVYNVEHIDEDNNDIININLDENLSSLIEQLENYKSNNMPIDQNKYSNLYSDLNTYFTPYEEIVDENSSIEIEVNENINTIIDNLNEMYSSIYSNNAIRNRRFVIQKYNLALNKLDTIDSTSSKLITVRTNITKNDVMSVKSFITLPEPIIRFSKINLPGTNILDKANLNLLFLNYWQLLKKKTNVSTIFVDNFENDLDFNEQNFANNIKNYVLNLSDDELGGMKSYEIYNKFVKHMIPKTRVLFNLMKKYITGKLSVVEVVSYLEPFLIYPDDLTFMQYREITDFIDRKISENNKKFVDSSRLFKSIGQIKMNQIISSKAYSIVEILNKNMRDDVLYEYDLDNPENKFTNSEILRKIMLRDRSQLYTSALSVQSFPLMFPSQFSNLFEEEKNKIGKKIDKNGENDEKCKNIIISKYYTSLEQLNEDNDKQIYFDKKYDKTNYGLLETTYEKQVLSMSPEDLHTYIVRDLLSKKNISETEANQMAKTLIDGHKEVVDGNYALLYVGYKERFDEQLKYYIRTNNKWELDTELNKMRVNTDEESVLCNLQEQCISVIDKNEEKCVSNNDDELGLQNKLLNDIIGEFDSKYKMSKEEFQQSVYDKFEYFRSIMPLLNKIETNNTLKYNNQKYNLTVGTEYDKAPSIVSPYQQILNLILRQDDFVKRQYDIVKFVDAYTRQSIDGLLGINGEVESPHWLYCIKTQVQLLPVFKYYLASCYVTNPGGYKDYLDSIISSIGAASDDGDWWCDKGSGWPICPTDFDVEEGYEEGFKASSRAIMEEDAGNKIISASVEKTIKYTTPETRMINNIINALCIAMGINIEPQKEFIINCVLNSIRDTVESESDYKVKIREMAEKGKKIMSYKDFYNTALLYYTLGSFLIAVQTSIPSVKTRKTHPGCVRSFSGYPFEGTGDLSSLNYLGCVAYDIRESGEPWNVLKSKKQEVIINKIKGSIDDVILQFPDVKRKFEEKTNYLLTAPASDIPDEHDIAKWGQFLPPLARFKIKHLSNISPEFERTLKSDLRSGLSNQREKLLVIDSKIIQFSLSIVERINEIVKKQNLLLHTSNNEPYLENACCESKEGVSTINYFISNDSRIEEYNQIVTRLSNIMDDVLGYSKSGMLFSNENTKNKYPEISKDFNEKTIYLAFIYFCKFKSLIPIPQDLLPLCTNKPENNLINPNDSIERMIQKLKDDGRNYNNDHFLRLLQVVSKNNIVNINVNKPEISSISKLTNLLETINDENDEVVEQSLRNLITDSLDSFEIATEDYTKEVKDLNNFLIKHIENMKEEIKDFVKKNTGSTISNSSVRKMSKTIDKLSDWVADKSSTDESNKISDDKLYNIVNFYRTFIDNFVNVFPNIIINNVNYNDIHVPNYYGFSKNHSGKLKKYIGEYYEKLKTFYDVPTLQIILSKIQKSSKNLVLLANTTPKFSSIKISEDKILKPVFDERTSRFLFEYYLLRSLINYIELSDSDEMVVTETRKRDEITDIFATEYLDDEETRVNITTSFRNQNETGLLSGNKKDLRQKTAELLVAFIGILDNEKDTIDISYKEIQDRVFKLREREKDLVTDRLKMMTDQERDADTILKINKLGMYSKGMQKGLTVLDKDFYDEEQQFRDQMTKAERNIRRKNPDANDENIDILLDEYIENHQNATDIDNDAYDMRDIDENFTDGNYYGNKEYNGNEEVDWDD